MVGSPHKAALQLLHVDNPPGQVLPCSKQHLPFTTLYLNNPPITPKRVRLEAELGEYLRGGNHGLVAKNKRTPLWGGGGFSL